MMWINGCTKIACEQSYKRFGGLVIDFAYQGIILVTFSMIKNQLNDMNLNLKKLITFISLLRLLGM